MTYIVNEGCIKCKYMDCVEVCPVDCFYEGENMLVIHPDECIDCGVCEPECPADAIKPDTEPGAEKWVSMNAEFAKIWPNITAKKEAPGRRQGMGGRPGQIREIFFSGTGNRQLSRSVDGRVFNQFPENFSPDHACFAVLHRRNTLIFAENVIYRAQERHNR